MTAVHYLGFSQAGMNKKNSRRQMTEGEPKKISAFEKFFIWVISGKTPTVAKMFECDLDSRSRGETSVSLPHFPEGLETIFCPNQFCSKKNGLAL